MAVGRNDPCPCGSGKKYKKCCLKKDAAERARSLPPAVEAPESGDDATAERPAQPPATSPKLDDVEEFLKGPKDADRDPFWEEFEGAGYEGQIQLFLGKVGDEDCMADGGAFEMLTLIHDEAMERKDWTRLAVLTQALRESLPDVYEADAPRYLHRMIAAALAAGDLDAVRTWARELGEKAGKDVDAVYNAIHLLAYHGHLDILLELMRRAWPEVQEAPGLVSWAVPEFAGVLRLYEVFDYLEHAASPDPGDPELLRRLEFDEDFDPSGLAPALEALSGRSARALALDHFKVVQRRRDDGEPGWELTRAGGESLNYLCNQFVAYLRQRGVPYTKAELGANELHSYVPRRLAGELRPRESLLESMMRREERRPRPRQPLRLPENVLCPDRETFDRFLTDLLHFMGPQFHQAAAAMEAVPSWLRFLEERGLLDSVLRERTLAEMKGLSASLADICEKQSGDPLLGPALRDWA